MRLLNYFIPGSIRVWLTQLLLGQEQQSKQIEELKTQLFHLQQEVAEMKKLLEAALTKTSPILLIVMLVSCIGATVVGARMIDYFETLSANDTITISGDGCVPRVVPALSPNQVRVKCFPPSEESKTAK